MSRKYRHQGYQDSDRQEQSERPQQSRAPRDLTDEERIQRKSMRKATNREANEVTRCHVCGRDVGDYGAIGFDSACPHCRAPLHCCRACTHFDSSVRWQCRAEIKEAVGDKNKANSCAQYQARRVLDFTGRRGAAASPSSRSSRGRSNDPRTQFENLFRR